MQNFLKSFLPIVLFILSYSNTYAQDSEKRIIHPFMRSIVVSVDGGLSIANTDYNENGLNFLFRGTAEYFLPTYTDHFVGIKIYGGAGTLSGNDPNKTPTEFVTSISFIGAGLTYGYRFNDEIFPNISAGLSLFNFSPEDNLGNELTNAKNGVYDKQDVNLNTELGIRYLISKNLTLNFNTFISFNFNDWLDDTERGSNNDIYYGITFGASYALFGDEDSDGDGIGDNDDQCPDTPSGVEVSEDGCPIDTDRDGVPDYLDSCPLTPSGVVVDSRGCPLDSDKDGVPDYADRCPNTPAGVQVYRNGCPVDSDADGVPDFVDKCPNTPRGLPVDRSGCPQDSDQDGVPDFADKCINTPQGVRVDRNGCPLDSDRDGIPDYLDKCPDTPLNVPVTVDGCSDNFKTYVLNATTLFQTSQAILTPEAYKELDKLIAQFNIRPRSKWRIEGHTDNQGNPENNKTLSLQRAQAVFNYFVSKGINPEKFEVIGLGEEFPIADNSTAEGRQQNRRVVLIRLD